MTLIILGGVGLQKAPLYFLRSRFHLAVLDKQSIDTFIRHLLRGLETFQYFLSLNIGQIGVIYALIWVFCRLILRAIEFTKFLEALDNLL